jgi:hypothetical protein
MQIIIKGGWWKTLKGKHSMIKPQDIAPGSQSKQHPIYGDVVVAGTPFDLGNQKAVWVAVRDGLARPAYAVVVLADLE